MKRLLFAMLCIVSALGMRAQTWLAPTIQGEDPVSGGKYTIYNVGAGMFINGGKAWFGWSTTAILATSGLEETFTGDAASFTLKRADGKFLFTSGNNITGDAMHVDGGNATNYGLTKLNNGNYRIHDAGGNESSPCWGYNSTFHATGVVAHADATAEGWKCEWIFIGQNSNAIYNARLALYNWYLDATEKGVSTDAYKGVYDNASATVAQLNEASASLKNDILQALLDAASNDNPQDITKYVLTNADFSAGNIDGWETNYVSGTQANNIGYQGASYTNGDVTISQFIEAWRWSPAIGDGYLRQTVSGLPEGKYVLEADAIAADQPGGTMPTGAQLYIQAAGVDYVTEMATADGKPQHFSAQFLSPGNVDVIFGLRTVNTTANWIGADNFKVTFYGIDLSPYAALLAQAVAEAQAIDTQTVTPAAADAITAAVDENNKEWSSSKEYSAAIAAIQAATTAAKATQAPYASYKTLKAQVEAMKNVEGYTETTSDATSTLTSTIAGIDETVEGATTAAEVTAQNDALKAAAKTFLAGVRSDGEHPFDITFLIVNPSFDNNNAEGWTANPAPGFQSFTNCEYYFGNTRTFDINQTLTDMPKGSYELKVQAFQRPGWFEAVYDAYKAGTNNVTSVIYINDGQTYIKNLVSEGATTSDNQWANGNDSNKDGNYYANSMNGAAQAFKAGYYWNTVLTSVEGDLKFGFKTTSESVDGDWTIFDNFQLYYYGNSINVTMDEAVAFSALADIEGANVTMTRNTKAGLNTIALPFDLTEAQVKEIFGDDAVVYAYSDAGEADATTVNFNTAETKITANVPVLVKATKASTKIEVDNVTVKTGEAKAAGNNFDFVGNYAGQVTIAAGDWFVSGGKLYESTGATTIKGFRAYLKDKNPAGSGEVKLYIDGVATAISEINADAQESGVIYNLAGQRVSKATRGIYVKNGKKVVVK